MLFDPRWIKKPKPSLSEPSFEGFHLFVALQMLRDPDGEYYWPDAWQCAVGQYLQSIGCWSRGWTGLEKYTLIDDLSRGDHPRDKRGRFTDLDRDDAVWRWRDLGKRMQKIAKWRKDNIVWV